MSELKQIKSQWDKPVQWSVQTEDKKVNVLDEDGVCVASSILHSHVKESIEEHLTKVREAMAIELMLSLSDEPEA